MGIIQLESLRGIDMYRHGVECVGNPSCAIDLLLTKYVDKLLESSQTVNMF